MKVRAVMLLVLVTVSVFSRAQTARPNIVIFLADDMGYRDLACYGCADIRTPHLDRLAQQGVRFTYFYANGAECTPTRAALMTGRYPQRAGGLECAIGTGNVGRYDDAIRLADKGELGLPIEQISIARLLKDAGYSTALFGKWHLGYDDKFSPKRHGFDDALYCLGGGMDYFHHTEEPPANTHVLRRNEKIEKREGYFTDIITDESIAFLKRQQPGRPFFLYVPFTSPHAPFQGPQDKLPAPLSPESKLWKQDSAPPQVYKAMVESLDQSIGQILATLTDQKVDQNTLVVFMSDNGGTASARPTQLRGIKGSTFEGGIRVPCIMRFPGRIAPGITSDIPAMTIDITRSVAKIANVTPGADRALDGIDIVSAVAANESPQRMLFWRARRGDRTNRAVRDGDLKMVSNSKGEVREEFLFDLKSDEQEKTNLLDQRPRDAARLRQGLAQWEERVRPER